ncbi:MAG: translation elongation factor 4, partial [Myxococcota bacterium]|nr:translation elongation factor 4 [Myxococcota bacterium]
EQDMEILPVVNKIDLPSADPDAVLAQLEDGVGVDVGGAVCVSAKSGLGIDELLEAIITFIPPPTAVREAPLRALVVDSWFDTYVGVVTLVRVVDGRLAKGDRVRFFATGAQHEVTRLGVFSPDLVDRDELVAGEVGFVVASIKNLSEARVGDTITHRDRAADEALEGFRDVKPMVFSGIYPVENGDYDALRQALEKLQLNDGSIDWQPETSDALGFGFRCGYLGLLHMEIVQERLEREYGLDLVTTSPSVVYRVRRKSGDPIEIHSPSKLPPVQEIEAIEEPIARVTIHLPDTYVGQVIKLCQERRGQQVSFEVPSQGRVILIYEIPYAEVVIDFFDRLKSCSRGYASMDYEVDRWEPADLIRLDIKVNGEPVDALSVIIHRETSYNKGQLLTRKLKEYIPRQMFQVAIQAAIGNKVIARTNGFFGFFKAEAQAIVTGTIESISTITGQVIFQAEPIPVEVD